MNPETQTVAWDEQQAYTIGVISDTHGMLRPKVMTSFKGVDLILHAGDVGDPEVIEHLASIAPVAAVRGNMDYGSWAEGLPHSKSLAVGKINVFVIHDVECIGRPMVFQGYQVIVTGHTHRPLMEERDNILFFNPGSAGPQRNRHPVSIGKLFFVGGRVAGRLIQLDA